MKTYKDYQSMTPEERAEYNALTKANKVERNRKFMLKTETDLDEIKSNLKIIDDMLNNQHDLLSQLLANLEAE